MKIAIASGKGGTGKTFVSTNLFWVAAQQGADCVLADCDAEEPNVAEFLAGEEDRVEEVYQLVPVIDPGKCTFCGKCYEYCTYNAILYLPERKMIQVLPDLCHDCGACSYACQAGAITEHPKLLGRVKQTTYAASQQIIEGRAEVGVYSPVPVITKTIHQTGERELVFLDSPPGISCPFIATVDRADYVVLVTEPTPFGLHDLQLSAATVRQLGKPFGVVVNRAGLGNNEIYQWLEQESIPLLLKIPFDREVARIYAEGGLPAAVDDSYREMFSRLLTLIVKQRIS
ncbi:MAG TPA: ATP-binding protein [Proteiniphilum sp.]|nr:ATP-binding protein [Proteiniphilum sp.]HPJ50028.1 ATP-binding protein [Proteiniphilum sp.]HPR19666.1 ATP-binding protein [Proteiniphilum sp.]